MELSDYPIHLTGTRISVQKSDGNRSRTSLWSNIRARRERVAIASAMLV